MFYEGLGATHFSKGCTTVDNRAHGTHPNWAD